MQFKDPYNVECPACGYQAAYSVSSLLHLTAECTSCGEPLIGIGENMHRMKTDWGIWLAKVELATSLERELGVSIEDPDIDNADTVLELIQALAGRHAWDDQVREEKATLATTVFKALFPELSDSEIETKSLQQVLAKSSESEA